jgi:choline monooxygenase
MRRRYEVACNWKAYVDNYLEGYHIPLVHPGLHRELDYGAYRVETARYHSRQHAPLRPVAGEAAGRKYVPTEADADAEYYWLFPNVTLNLYQGLLQTNAIEPLGVDRTAVLFDWYAAEPPADPTADATWQTLVAFSDEIQAEDAEICAAVQRNLRSRAYDRGRYAPARENGVHHFHGLLCEFVSRGRGDAG